MKDRIYVCHTYYHAYISFLKELALREKNGSFGGATLVLSLMSNDFESFMERARATGVFDEIVEYDERREDSFPSLDKYRVPGNIVKNMINRMRLMKAFSRELEPFCPVDFKEYKDIYVFCDRDPIGIYLTGHRIHYHAVEDGLNTLQYVDLARFEGGKLFKLKAFLSKKLNLYFLPNGYAAYCDDMEVNDLSVLKYVAPNYIEVPRKQYTDRLTEDDKRILIKAFIRNSDGFMKMIEEMGNEDKILILTDPVCSLDIRERIFKDIIDMFKEEGRIFLKPHPRDMLDYERLFAEYPRFDATVPMELLNFIPGLRFKKAVGVLTEMSGVSFADEAVRLGPDFMDKYEAPEIHRQNEYI